MHHHHDSVACIEYPVVNWWVSPLAEGGHRAWCWLFRLLANSRSISFQLEEAGKYWRRYRLLGRKHLRSRTSLSLHVRYHTKYLVLLVEIKRKAFTSLKGKRPSRLDRLESGIIAQAFIWSSIAYVLKILILNSNVFRSETKVMWVVRKQIFFIPYWFMWFSRGCGGMGGFPNQVMPLRHI
jgi:hypothetical protein